MYDNSNNPYTRNNDKKTKLVKDIMKGDVVETPYGKTKVFCVIKTKCPQVHELIKYKELLITPYHPIKIEKNPGIFEWVFPINVGENVISETEYVYSFVLEHHHQMVIENVYCATMGHCNKENDVIAHDFFGTNKVLDALSKCEGWKDGLVEFENDCLLRDQETNRVIGFK
jgi:hypothetical protein